MIKLDFPGTRRITAFAWPIISFVWVAGPAAACGSMAPMSNGDVITMAGAVLTFASIVLFAPMIVLIPVELAILKRVGALGDKYWAAYFYCLGAKVAGVALVTGAAAIGTVREVVLAEALYSLTHFVFSYLILRSMSPNPIETAALISTVIPWLYSAGIPATAFLMRKLG
ncbi:MAG: hypothetical protein ABL955_01800 [Elusimicrobiota bacterium]